MSPESNWAAAGSARELALIRHVLELQIEHYELYGRWPTPDAIQRQLHGPLTSEPSSS